MKDWKPPLTKKGRPCRNCKPAKPCPKHRPQNVKVQTGKRTPYKLKRELLDELPGIIERSRNLSEIWEGIQINPWTFYDWMHRGEKDLHDGVMTLEREFYEKVHVHRRILAQRMIGRAVEAAEGVVVQEETKEGPRTYKTPPDGRLAVSIARSLDPIAMPPEKQEVKHEGEINIAIEARERLKALFKDSPIK